ncbi:GNAT family N-acetyltransferase [Pararhodobacter sp. SW119]|uniref:GNAT family N-acetyltransferase n=1 Tax=Pararhodobacter sp. SW119 TaxID=2780075 RepID=UPI001AE02D35|nr:GNAT family N-acetyltransferase [Pararhodobacter sp. SW119]
MIRPARREDADAIAGLWNPIIRDTDITFNPVEKTPLEVAALIAERHTADLAFLVAEQDCEILGFAGYAQFRGGQGYARTMEHSVNLVPGARGKGLGRALMRALEDHAIARSRRTLIGAITATNLASLDFHCRLGFAEVGRIAQAGWKFGRYHDLVFMQKLLDPPDGQGQQAALD